MMLSDALYQKALSCMDRGEFFDALCLLNDLIQQGGHEGDCLLKKGDCLLKLNNVYAAVRVWEDYLTSYGGSLEVYSRISLGKFMVQDWSGAHYYSKKSIDLGETSEDVLRIFEETKGSASGAEPCEDNLSSERCEQRSEYSYVFVVGCGHTGTSLMAAMLGNHSSIHSIPTETGVFFRNVTKKPVVTQLNSFIGEGSKGKKIICEKTPTHVYQIGKIRSLFPQAKIIIMIRDGRDVSSSLKKRTGSFHDAIVRWNFDTEESLKWRKDCNVKFVKYESLIKDVQAALADICNFVGVQFESGMLNFHQDERDWFGAHKVETPVPFGEENHPSFRNWQIHQPLFDGRGKWRETLSVDEIEVFNKFSSELMEELAYYDASIGTLPGEGVTIKVESYSESKNLFSTWVTQLRNNPLSNPIEQEDFYEDFLDEKHHSSYGRPWCIGRFYFETLMDHGLERDHHVLDFGCGCGRLGTPLIRYLKPNRYFGIDVHRPSLDAFAQYEIPLHGLSYKMPRILHDTEASIETFNKKFDIICDFYVTHHLELDNVAQIYQKFIKVLKENGRVFLAHPPTLSQSTLKEIGFEVCHVERRAVPFLQSSRRNFQKLDNWHILRRSSSHSNEQ